MGIFDPFTLKIKINKNNNKDQKILNARWISHYFHILRNIFDTFLTFLKIFKKEEKWLIIKLEGYHNLLDRVPM